MDHFGSYRVGRTYQRRRRPRRPGHSSSHITSLRCSKRRTGSTIAMAGSTGFAGARTIPMVPALHEILLDSRASSGMES